MARRGHDPSSMPTEEGERKKSTEWGRIRLRAMLRRRRRRRSA